MSGSLPPRGELRHGDATAKINFLWNDAGGVSTRHRRMAHSVDRSGGEEFPADDSAAPTARLVQSGTRPDGPTDALEFSEIERISFPLARRVIRRNGARLGAIPSSRAGARGTV